MKISFVAPEIPKNGTIVLGVADDRTLGPTARVLDAHLGGCISRAINGGRFKGKKNQGLVLVAPGDGNLDHVVLIGLGDRAEIDVLSLQAAGRSVFAYLAPLGSTSAWVAVDHLDGVGFTPVHMALEMAFGAQLRSYRFDKYFTKAKAEDKPALERLDFGCEGHTEAKKLYQHRDALADAVFFSRDLVSEPANVVDPDSLAEAAKSLEKMGVEVEVLGEKEMKKLGMGALLGVGQGSEKESRLVVMQWWGAGKPDTAGGKGAKDKGKSKAKDKDKHTTANDGHGDAPGPIAFCGKGVTFDTGGISIKPAANMEEMKTDMAGSAAVIGVMKALAGRNARANVVGVIGVVENMPSGNAQRPGDVVTSMSGQTIEVINTDAEGRLVLADVLWYTKERFKPRLIVDLATLTGAIIISLGHEKAGLFASDDDLADNLYAAGEAVGEPLWRMPLGEAYDKMIKSEIADMKNVGNRGAGSITAAQFLKRFVDRTPWAHLDIAGVAWSRKGAQTEVKGASGFGVRLLDRLIADHYEEH
jgi:leucyl aminopeptidase